MLAGILVLIGMKVIEAKKPQPWKWSVDIPGAGAGENLFAYDAYGAPGGNTFTYVDGSPIHVEVGKGQRGRDVSYSFRLRIVKDQYNFEKIGFQGLDLTNDPESEPTGTCPCSFPPNNPCPELGPDVMVPDCMEDFIVDNPHPYTDLDPYYDYEIFWLSIDVDCDIESMAPGEIFPSGNVHIEIHRTDSPNPEGDEDLHSIVVGRDVDEGSGIITITRGGYTDPDSWTIIVEDSAVRFTEAYWGYWGKGKGRFETKKPIRAIAPFGFTTTWTRSR
jgi:hypothetical protein